MSKTIFILGQKLPVEISIGLLEASSTGVVDLPSQTAVMVLDDFRPNDVASFEGPARLRIGRFKTFMVFSPAFKNFTFDIVWSPVTARQSREALIGRPNAGEHMPINFILADAGHVIRAIRTATVSTEVTMAIHRAQLELLASPVDPEDLNVEMMGLFMRHQGGIPDDVFHEVCNFGD